jgi:hypothetical protein
MLENIERDGPILSIRNDPELRSIKVAVVTPLGLKPKGVFEQPKSVSGYA